MQEIKSTDYLEILKRNHLRVANDDVEADVALVSGDSVGMAFSAAHISGIQREHRIKTLKLFRSIAGENVKVANDVGDPHIAAFVPKTEAVARVTLETLDMPLEQVRKIAKHEYLHIRDLIRGIRQIDLERSLHLHRLHALNEAFEADGKEFAGKIEDVNLIEGLTEARTALEEGKNCNCAYNHHEVPAVKALENLAIKKIGVSLISGYEISLETFYQRLKILSDRLILEKMAKNLRPEGVRFVLKNAGIKDTMDENQLESLRPILLERIHFEKVIGEDMDDLRRIFGKFLQEALTVQGLQKFFHGLATIEGIGSPKLVSSQNFS